MVMRYVLKDGVDVLMEERREEDLVGFLRGMIAIPEYVIGDVSTRKWVQVVAQIRYLYFSRTTASIGRLFES